MKILLIYPPGFNQSHNVKTPFIDVYPPIGLYYLNSFLMQNGYDCKVYDFFFDTWSYIEVVLREENADIIGISCLSETRQNSLKLISIIQKINKKSKIIFGGHHSTHMYEQLLNHYEIDYVVLGEGEIKLLNLLKVIEGKLPLESVKGIAYKINGRVIKNGSHLDDLIEDLDFLPFPYSEAQLTLFKKYLPIIYRYPIEVEHLSQFAEIFEKGKCAMIATSRGCPFNCKFCAASVFWGNKYRLRSPENIVDEIEFYHKSLGILFFKILDSTFTLIPERSIQVCKELVNRNLNIFFECFSRPESITEELVLWLKKAGCICISLGVESGSKKILHAINKSSTVGTIIKSFSILNKYDLLAEPFLMVGNPGETEVTIKKTISLLRLIKPQRIRISKTSLLPGTNLYRIAKEQGFIDDNFWHTQKPRQYYTFENSLKTLKKWEFSLIYYDKRIYQLNLLKLFFRVKSLVNILTIKFKKKLDLKLYSLKAISNSHLNRIYFMIKEKIKKMVNL